MKKWFSIPECAAYLGISEHTLYQYVSKRTIPFIKVPNSNLVRFDVEKIDDWMRSGSVQTVSEALKGGTR